MNPLVGRLLDEVAADNAKRPQFGTPFMSRITAELAIDAILACYGSRRTDAAGIYAYESLMRALDIDWGQSQIVRLSKTTPSA